MSLQGHLVELERRHEAIEREIKTHLSSPSSSSEKLAELKRKKLLLKDEITKIRTTDPSHILN